MIITVINQKGGTGKTTTTVNVGAALAKSKQNVMLVDFDPQGNLSYSLGVNDFEFGVRDVLSSSVGWADILEEREGMYIAPSDQRLSALKFGTKDPEFTLRKSLEVAHDFDYVLIDCPPSLSLLTINALAAADRVLIPIQLDVFSIQGLVQILDTVNEVKMTSNPELEILGVLPVLVDNRKSLTREIKQHVIDNFDVHVFKNEVRTNVKAAEAPSFGKSVVSYSPSSNSAQDYLKVSKEIKKLIKVKA
ncbi:MAG: ParA family protein [Cyclobacteriaceae bacterium]